MNQKGLYCYICAMSGSGDNTYTSRAKVLMDLGIARTTYDRCMDGIEEKNIIARYQKTQKGQIRGHGNWTGRGSQMLRQRDPRIAGCRIGRLRLCVWLGLGNDSPNGHARYGLPLKARALYGYIRAYAGMNGSTNPNRERVMRELNITQNT